jgi:hypothetical protein
MGIDRGIAMNRRTRRIALVIAAATLVAIPAAAFAGSVFNDVDDSNIFIGDISWLKDTGVTKGCNPPLNTDFCPTDDVTRQEMAAFLHRLAINRVVDADTVDGKDAVDLEASTGSAVVDDVTFDPAGGNPKLLTSLTGFDVPASGGVITAHANAVTEPLSGPQLGLVWIEIDGNGTCPDPVSYPGGAGVYLTLDTIVDSTSAIATMEVPAGSTRIDLCIAGFGTDTSAVWGHLSATWSPDASSAGVAGVQPRDWHDILAPYAGVLNG